MAYVYVKAHNMFVGKSTDTDPTEGILQGMKKYDTDTQGLEIYDGSAWATGGNPVQVTGSKLEEQKTQADAVANVITFSSNIQSIEIFHQEATWQTFVVNGLTINVPAGGYRSPIGGTPAATVTIPANVSCIVGRLV